MNFRLLGLLFILALVQVSCNADPWPEPDPSPSRDVSEKNDNEENEKDSEKDSKDKLQDENVGKETASDDDNDFSDTGDEVVQDSDNKSEENEEAPLIYCSAPGQDGLATLVGLPGALNPEGSLLIVGENEEESAAVPSTDGSFAVRVAAVPNEKLTLTLVHQTTEDPLGKVIVGSNEDNPLSGLFLGSLDVDGSVGGDGGSPVVIDIEISPPDADEMVTIRGAGALLSEDFRIIAANLDLNTGRDALITCSPDCQFTLSIPGRSGDQIDIFMASKSDNLGYTNVQTIEVP